MSLAARVTKADDFSAPDGKSHGHTALSDSNVPISSGLMRAAATAILAMTNSDASRDEE